MRAVFGVVGLLVTLAIVGVLAKKQLGGLSTVATPAGVASAPQGVTVKEQSQLIQQQVKQSVENTLQRAQPMPDEK